MLEIIAVPVASSVVRGVPPVDVEQVLDVVPVLREIDYDLKLAGVLKWLSLALAQESPEVQVLRQALVDSLHDAQGQLDVREFPEIQLSRVQSRRLGEQVVDVPVRGRVPRAAVSGGRMELMLDVPVRGRVPRAAVSGGRMDQMVDVPVPGRISSEVTERFVEQVENVPVFRGAPLHRANQQITGSSAAALDLSEEPFKGFFALFPAGKKVRQLGAGRVRHWARTPAHGRRGLMATWTPWLDPAGYGNGISTMSTSGTFGL